MKNVKYILGILAILAIGFFALGLFKPKLSYACEIMVEKPRAESWAVAQDEEKLSAWLPGFQKIEHISGTPGTVGAVSNVYFDDDGRSMAIRETITAIVPEESISMSYSNDFMVVDYKMTMTPFEGKTKIASRTTAEGNSLFAKSLMVLVGSSFRDQEETNLANLKTTIENNKKDYSQGR